MVSFKKLFLILLFFCSSLKPFEVMSPEVESVLKAIEEKKLKLKEGETIHIGEKAAGTGAGVGPGGPGTGVSPEKVATLKKTTKPSKESAVKPEKKELNQQEKKTIQKEIIKIFKDVRIENLKILSSNDTIKNPPNPIEKIKKEIKKIKNIKEQYLEKISNQLDKVADILKIDSSTLFKFKNENFVAGKELNNIINSILDLFKNFVINFKTFKQELTTDQQDYDLQSTILSFIINAKAYEKSKLDLNPSEKKEALSDDTFILLLKNINDLIKKNPDDQIIKNIFFNNLNILRMSSQFAKQQYSLFTMGSGPTGSPAIMYIALNTGYTNINLQTLINSIKQCLINPDVTIEDLKEELTGKTDATDQETFENIFKFFIGDKKEGSDEEKEIEELVKELTEKRELTEAEEIEEEALIGMQTMFKEAELERRILPKTHYLISKISKTINVEILEKTLSELLKYYKILQQDKKGKKIQEILNLIDSIKTDPKININGIIKNISNELKSIDSRIKTSIRLTEAFVNLHIKHIFLLMIPKFHLELLKNIWFYLKELIKEAIKINENLITTEKNSLNLNYKKLQTTNIYSTKLDRIKLMREIKKTLEIDKITNKELKEKVVNCINLALNTIYNSFLGLEVNEKTFEDFILEKTSLIKIKRVQNNFLMIFYNYPWLFGSKSIKPIIGTEYKNIEPFFKFINPYGLLLLTLQAATSSEANLLENKNSLLKLLKYFEKKQEKPIETFKQFIEKPQNIQFKDDKSEYLQDFKSLEMFVPKENQLSEYNIYQENIKYISAAIEALKKYDVGAFVLNMKKYLQGTSLSFFNFEKNLETKLQKKFNQLKQENKNKNAAINADFKVLIQQKPPQKIRKTVKQHTEQNILEELKHTELNLTKRTVDTQKVEAEREEHINILGKLNKISIPTPDKIDKRSYDNLTTNIKNIKTLLENSNLNEAHKEAISTEINNLQKLLDKKTIIEQEQIPKSRQEQIPKSRQEQIPKSRQEQIPKSRQEQIPPEI